MFHVSVSLMNRLNKTECGIFLPCMIFLLLRDLLFKKLLIVIATGVKCRVAALKSLLVLHHSALFYIFRSFRIITSCLFVLNIQYCFKPALGGVGDVHFSVSLMNRLSKTDCISSWSLLIFLLSKTESGIFFPCMVSLLLTYLLFRFYWGDF